MNQVRRLTMLVGAVALVAVGLALAAESTEIAGGRWRRTLADVVEATLDPGWVAWQSALAGAGLALVAITLVAAEFSRPSKGTRIMHNVHETSSGSTRITGKAAMSAARRQVDGIEGVVDVTATTTKSTMTVAVQVDDRADLAAVEDQVRHRLDHEFWINLGLADFAVNVLITHHPNPPRVR